MFEILEKKIKVSPIILFFILSVVFSFLFYRNAWVAEDAFITFRSVDQLLAGNGPVWNIGERVQVYTHPLWYFLIVIGTAIFEHSYWVVLGLSYLCLLGILYFLIKIIGTQNSSKYNLYFLLIVSILALSRAFNDYSSSGLENPLVHLLLIVYVYIFIKPEITLEKRFFITSFIYGLVFITRPDGIFLITPSSLYLLIQMIKEKKSWFKLSILSIIPVLLWETFSIIYYGSFVPNTALAKVNIGYDNFTLLIQAWHFFIFNFKHDPLTLITIISAIVFSLFNRNITPKLLAFGLFLQLIYIQKVGADYMMGRFLSPSLLISVLALLLMDFDTEKLKKRFTQFYGFALLMLWVSQSVYTLFTTEKNFSHRAFENGIADERSFYFQELGLISVLYNHQGNYQNHFWIKEGRELSAENPYVSLSCIIGMKAWGGPLNAYWIDALALSEPFLARLHAAPNKRIGHYERAFPMGYFESTLTGKNHFESKKLGELFKDVGLVVSGDLFSKKRFEAIYRLNTGYYKDLEKEFDINATGLQELGMPVEKNPYGCMGRNDYSSVHLNTSKPTINWENF